MAMPGDKWPIERRHHPWCNDHNPVGPGLVLECTMCPGLFKNHPVRWDDTPDTLMHRYFPNNKRVDDGQD